MKSMTIALLLYNPYIGLVSENAKEVNAFYFKPNCKKFSFDKAPVGINTLNSILPEMCEKAGLKRKTAHSLRVTCASSLFNAGVDEKLIRDRTGHKYNALQKYEKGNEMNLEIVSGLLGPNANKAKATVCNVATDSKVTTDKCMSILGSGLFANCTINVNLCNKPFPRFKYSFVCIQICPSSLVFGNTLF